MLRAFVVTVVTMLALLAPVGLGAATASAHHEPVCFPGATDAQGGPCPSEQLWQIRDNLGKGKGLRVVGFGLRAAGDGPCLPCGGLLGELPPFPGRRDPVILEVPSPGREDPVILEVKGERAVIYEVK